MKLFPKNPSQAWANLGSGTLLTPLRAESSDAKGAKQPSSAVETKTSILRSCRAFRSEGRVTLAGQTLAPKRDGDLRRSMCELSLLRRYDASS
jgi:hypothetical protein